MEEPRTVFYVPSDRKAIVYFEWEGSPGRHHMEGIWKDPDGKSLGLSTFDYDAKDKIFGAYWNLTLPEDAKAGTWTLEAHVDGELAGTQTFQVVASTPPPATAPARPMLSPADVYKLATAATVTLTKVDPAGETIATGSGFCIKPGILVTAFDVIDGGSSLRALLPSGETVPVDGILSWNRVEDWAVLRVSAPRLPGLTIAPAHSWAVGEDYFSLQASAEGGRSIVAGSITGTHNYPDLGERIHLSLSAGPQSSGSPILNSYGEVIAVMQNGSLLPGSWSLGMRMGGYPQNFVDAGSSYALQNVLAVPIGAVRIPETDQPMHPLDELVRAGQFIFPLGRSRNVSQGTVARGIERRGPVPMAVDPKFEYSQRDGEISVLLTWVGVEKIRSQLGLRAYNLHNQVVIESKPHKFSLDPSKSVSSIWKIDVSNLPPGPYRVDVLLDVTPAWRTFFRVVQ